MDYQGVGYVADGQGGYETCENASPTWGDGTTIRDYVDLARILQRD